MGIITLRGKITNQFFLQFPWKSLEDVTFETLVDQSERSFTLNLTRHGCKSGVKIS
jgi:hypothetical protein